MTFPDWTLGSIILYGSLTLLVIFVAPLERAGMAMMEYSKFRAMQGIPTRLGMTLIYGLPLVALFAGAAPYRSAPDTYQAVVFSALLIHFSKRLLESWFLHKYSGPMNPLTALAISLFYSLTSFLPACINREPISGITPLVTAGFGVFLFGETMNFLHHKILADLRRKSMEYAIPRGGLFEYIICPHYLFEIISWFGLFLMFRHLSMFLFFAFMMMYLMARSLRTLRWYRDRFPEFPADRKAILPFIL